MPNTQATSDVVPATVLWERLSEHVDRLIEAWESTGEPPALTDFLPAEPQTLRRLALIELVKVDLEYRWRGGRWPKQIEQYVEEFPELSDDGVVPCDLVYEEYHIRRQLGVVSGPQDYLERFPGQAVELARLLNLEAPDATTTLVQGTRVPSIDVDQQFEDFDLLTELGRGAFARVFLARQRSMQRLVALKISGDKGSEPQTMAQLDHPHIVRVFDQRQLPDKKLRLLYMQHVPGGTLQQVLEQRRSVPAGSTGGNLLVYVVDRAIERHGDAPLHGSSIRHRLERATWPECICWLGARLASALDYAHERGVLHRDLKPANVLLAADCSPKLADFNISFSSKLDGVTPAAYFGGSLAYMSPEQLEACDPAHPRQPSDLDGRSDVYSLGVMLWELLTGSRPFADEPITGNWSQTVQRMAEQRRAGVGREAIARLPADCPAGLKDALLDCLEADRDKRFRTAGDVARELDLCLQPRAQRLLHSSQAIWQRLPRRFPTMALVLAGVLPNVVLSALNVAYNWFEIVQHLRPEVRRLFFDVLLATVNGVAYTIGVAMIIYLFWPVFRALRRLANRQPIDAAELPALRARCLRMGDYAAWVSALEWTISGFVFPFWMHMHTGSGLSFHHYIHFITSQVLCGLMSATLTFFFITFIAVRIVYPWFVQPATTEADESQQLVALSRRIWLYFLLTGIVPFLALPSIVMLAGRWADEDTAGGGLGPLLGLGAVGLVAFVLALWFDRAIRGDIAALAAAIDPAGVSLATFGESSDSFGTGSR